MKLLFGDADITGLLNAVLVLGLKTKKVIQEPINHSHDSCPQKTSAEVLQEQMKDKMTALSATKWNVIGEALTDVTSDVL